MIERIDKYDQSWLTKLAWILSRIFSPIFTLPILVYWVCMLTLAGVSQQMFQESILTFLIFFFIIPSMLPVLGFLTGKFQDMNIPDQEDRDLIYTIFLLSSLGGTIILAKYGAPNKLIELAILAILGAMACAAINRYYVKISLHCLALTAAWAFIALTCYHHSYYIYAGGLLVPLVAWARIRLKRHTSSECILGTLLGLIFGLVSQVSL